MARQSLIIVAVILAGCKTTDTRPARIEMAAVTLGQANADIPFPEMPSACTTKVGRAVPGDEPWVITNKRWEILAENRDRQARDCAAWGADMKQKYKGAH